jgi:hypothetical protein
MTRRLAPAPNQLAFTFDAPSPARQAGDLAGLERMMSAAVARMLKEDPRSREEVAGRMSALLGEEISRWMLDAYASEAREAHHISAARFLALVAATDRFDVLDSAAIRIGARVLVGEEVHTARVGHLRAEKARIDAELRLAERMVRPMDRATGS